ncbi:uncharacterized protein LOC106867128 [Octopus bimaculoides]|uniref:uncharacterized protein LOC106867128 n=1 Tax=Octopus bimaculoides TaxID=37653 RepID=UPI0022E2AD55|nr:uncharacterized protein LOC106867128 [Octopus bimaculoides]
MRNVSCMCNPTELKRHIQHFVHRMQFSGYSLQNGTKTQNINTGDTKKGTTKHPDRRYKENKDGSLRVFFPQSSSRLSLQFRLVILEITPIRPAPRKKTKLRALDSLEESSECIRKHPYILLYFLRHGNKEVFSCKGIKYAVDYFKKRGHKKIVVFVPHWRKEASRKDAPIIDQEILTELEKERILIFTPARMIKGKRVACYDDRYILKVADENNGIVVSNDNYRDLLNENNGFKKVVEERLLMYSFVEDKFMPPDDPLGRHGPSLDNFLRKTPTAPETLPPNCPYGKKCTYGNKCKFYHPERGNMPHKTVTEKLAEQYKQQEKVLEAEKNKMQLKSKGKSPLSRSKSRYADGGDVPQLSAEEQEEKQRLAKEYNEKLDRSRREITRFTEQTEAKEKAAANKNISEVHLSQHSLSNLDSGNQGNKAVHFEMFNSPSLDKFNKSTKHQQEFSTCDHLDINRAHSLPAQIQSENFVSGHLQLAKSLSGEEIEAKKKTQNSPQSSPQHPPLCRQSSVYVDTEHHIKANPSMTHKLPTCNQFVQDMLPNLFQNHQGDCIFIPDTMSPSYSYTGCESFSFPSTSYPYGVSDKMILGQAFTPSVTRQISLPNTRGQERYSPSYQVQVPDKGQQGFYETIPSSPSCLSPAYSCSVTSNNNVSFPSFIMPQQLKVLPPARRFYSPSCYTPTQQQSLPQQHMQQQQQNPVMSPVMSTASWPLDNTSYSDMLVHPTMGQIHPRYSK